MPSSFLLLTSSYFFLSHPFLLFCPLSLSLLSHLCCCVSRINMFCQQCQKCVNLPGNAGHVAERTFWSCLVWEKPIGQSELTFSCWSVCVNVLMLPDETARGNDNCLMLHFKYWRGFNGFTITTLSFSDYHHMTDHVLLAHICCYITTVFSLDCMGWVPMSHSRHVFGLWCMYGGKLCLSNWTSSHLLSLKLFYVSLCTLYLKCSSRGEI